VLAGEPNGRPSRWAFTQRHWRNGCAATSETVALARYRLSRNGNRQLNAARDTVEAEIAEAEPSGISHLALTARIRGTPCRTSHVTHWSPRRGRKILLATLSEIIAPLVSGPEADYAQQPRSPRQIAYVSTTTSRFPVAHVLCVLPEAPTSAVFVQVSSHASQVRTLGGC
jgi:hypothetical protein